MAKPEDTRCRALTEDGQCENQITFDQEADAWLVWCDEHAEQEKVARAEGGERVARFEENTEQESEESGN